MKFPSHPRRNLLRAPHWPSEVSSKGCLTRFRGSGRERGCGQGWSLTWALVTEISSISLRGAALLHQNKPMGRANRRVRRDLRASRTVLWNWVRWWDVGGGGGSLTLYQNCPGRNTKGAASARGAWPVGFGAGVCCVLCWGCLSFSSFCAHCAVVVKIGAVIKGYRPPGPAGEERIRGELSLVVTATVVFATASHPFLYPSTASVPPFLRALLLVAHTAFVGIPCPAILNALAVDGDAAGGLVCRGFSSAFLG